jgi:ribonuclease HI
MSRPEVAIYTDGACRPNPGPGGWAAILQWEGRERVLTGGHADTTNNRMELQAAIAGLHALKQPSFVDLYTDSTYLQRGITEWLASWVARGWRKADRKPVQNADLWRQLHELVGEHEVQWHWVHAHSGNTQNERVDSLAYAAIERFQKVS